MAQYTLRTAVPEDGVKIWQIMDSCRKQLENQDYFVCDNQYYVNDILTNSGFAVVACDEHDQIVGNLLVKYPGMDEENLGYDLSFDFTELPLVVHMDSCSVLPHARGNGLEYQLISYAESIIDKERYRYLLATVSPENIPSVRSLTKLGYKISLTKEKYSGIIRHIMMKDLHLS